MLKMLSNDSVNETEIGKISEFVALLPQEFTKDQANEIGIGKIGLSARTVTNYLNRLRQAESIDRISYGNYRKKVLSIP
jgi:hypothetical protein